MIKFLRANRPSFLVLGPLLALVVCLAALWLADVPFRPSGWAWFDAWVEDQKLLRGLLLALLISGQAYLLYRICVVGSFFQQNTQSPALLWALLAASTSILETNFTLHLALFFSLISALRMVRVYRQNRVLNLLFEAGFWAGLAMVFETGMIILLLSLVLALAYTRSSNWREWTVMLLGVAAPWYGCLALAFILTGRVELPDVEFTALRFPKMQELHTVMWLILLLVGGVLGLLAYIRSYSEDNNQTRTAKNTLLFYVLPLQLGLLWFADGQLLKTYMSSMTLLALLIPFVLFLPRRSGRIMASLTLLSVVAYIALILSKEAFVLFSL